MVKQKVAGRNRRIKSGSAPGKKTKKKDLTLWDQASRWYDSLVGSQGTDFQKDIIMPGVLRLLEVSKKDRVLDLACGQGVFSRYLSGKGIQVEGLDSSAELLKFARSRSTASVRYRVGDASDPKNFKANSFDGIACLMAIQNIEKMDQVFSCVCQWLKPGKCFVMVMTHPCFRMPRQSHWGWDEDKKMEYRRVDHYMTETNVPILTPPFADSKSFTLTYHRPMQSYISALAQAGLCVDGMEEWISNKKSQPGKRAKAENRARKEIPLFLAVRARLIN
ncbi:MAG: class I SAM-dependent methyltransferase [Nitrospinae bacterium]|nr:class I SAM-dependent methyltransferase [Nitrospinota bacterium]